MHHTKSFYTTCPCAVNAHIRVNHVMTALEYEPESGMSYFVQFDYGRSQSVILFCMDDVAVIDVYYGSLMADHAVGRPGRFFSNQRWRRATAHSSSQPTCGPHRDHTTQALTH
jgi:hypothetical protein